MTGAAEFVDGHRALLRTARGDESIEFDAAVLATGSAPVFPPPFDARRGDVLDSDGALALERVPTPAASASPCSPSWARP